MSKESNSAIAEKSGGIEEENLTVEQMEELYENSMKLFKEGEVTSGTVIAISNDKVVVDVGFKSEGIISAFEFPGGADSVNIGDTVEVFIDQTENQDGVMILSVEKAARLRKWDAINKVYEAGNTIKGKVIGKIKGGLTVDIGLRAFLPGSQIDLRPPKNMDEYLGREYEYKIIKMNKRRGNIVLSRRAIIEEERKASKAETLSNLEEGAIVTGIVKNITDYGAFIDLGGVDGLLHITDMSWGRINHPSEILSVGQSAKVIVLKFDTESERVSLGLKQQSEDPWKNIEEKYSIGTNVKGKVVSITDYGAFLELENGVEGLVHISEMTWSKHVRHPSRIVNPGDDVEAEVLNIDKERKRISLGMKQVSSNPWENIEERYPVDTIIEGTVRNLTDFGAFVEIEDGVDGLIHISDMSWTAKVKHPSEVVKKKDRVKAKVLKIDKDGERISLGLKQLEPDPWESVADKYKIGQEISATIVKVTNFGAFAEIEPGIEGLIHVSQISGGATDARKELTVGNKCDVKVIKVDAESKKIGLSMKDGPIDDRAGDETDFETEDFPEEE
ncbi:MAG: 30S ribosomal protein S1 [Nitrospinota bacterium]|nr:30S ribosomal protein S1 [Nitrospinota bacterium]